MKKDRLITLAIHTYQKALILKGILESQGIPVAIQNVNLLKPVISPGVRVRIHEKDLPHALDILENDPVFGNSEIAEKPQKNRILNTGKFNSDKTGFWVRTPARTYRVR